MDQLTERSIANQLFIDLRSSAICIAPCWTPGRWFECDVAHVTLAGYFVEHEIKLTRSDFRADELKGKYAYDPGVRKRYKITKHSRLADHDPNGPSRFWFVVPKGMIGVNDLPPWAGLKYAEIRPHYRRPVIRTIKKAPRLHNHKVESAKIAARMQRNLAQRYWWDRLRRK